VATGTISAILHGHVPSPSTVSALADYFGADIGTVLEIAGIWNSPMCRTNCRSRSRTSSGGCTGSMRGSGMLFSGRSARFSICSRIGPITPVGRGGHPSLRRLQQRSDEIPQTSPVGIGQAHNTSDSLSAACWPCLTSAAWVRGATLASGGPHKTLPWAGVDHPARCPPSFFFPLLAHTFGILCVILKDVKSGGIVLPR